MAREWDYFSGIDDALHAARKPVGALTDLTRNVRWVRARRKIWGLISASPKTGDNQRDTLNERTRCDETPRHEALDKLTAASRCVREIKQS